MIKIFTIVIRYVYADRVCVVLLVRDTQIVGGIYWG